MARLHFDTATDLAVAIAQTWSGPSAGVWEDVIASNDVELRIGELTYRRLRDETESRTLAPATFLARYAELRAQAMSERTPDVGPCKHCQGSPGWTEITDPDDRRYHGPDCRWLALREAGQATEPWCACRPSLVPCSCPLGERARVQGGQIERRRAVRSTS